jgi:hypothetical protein
MSFNSNTIDYEIIHERLKARKINDIIIKMKEFLIFNHQQLKEIKKFIETQINKHHQDVVYEVND